MLLIWLLLPAVSAIIDCKSACDLCQMDNDQATIYITCTLCRKCHWALNPRRMMDLQTPNSQLKIQGQVLNDKQLTQLKKAELSEFKNVLNDYGWKPEDLADGNINDLDEDCLEPPATDCLENTHEEEKRQLLKGKKKRKCPSTTCAPATATTRKCPPIKPCKKHTDTITDQPSANATIEPDPLMPASTNQSALRELRKRILRQLADLDTSTQEDGCPTQPVCSDEESEEHHRLANKKFVFTPPPTTASQDKIDKGSTLPFCVPCMPQCPLPCMAQMPLPLPAPMAFPIGIPGLLPSQIPIEAIQALMTLKTTKQTESETTTEKEIQKETTTEKKVKEVSASSAESPEADLVSREESTKTTTGDEFLHLYIGVPKNVKNVRRG